MMPNVTHQVPFLTVLILPGHSADEDAHARIATWLSKELRNVRNSTTSYGLALPGENNAPGAKPLSSSEHASSLPRSAWPVCYTGPKRQKEVLRKYGRYDRFADDGYVRFIALRTFIIIDE
jgi:hypothetical protein